MPVGFLTQEQRDGFDRYGDTPSRDELERYFDLNDEDCEGRALIGQAGYLNEPRRAWPDERVSRFRSGPQVSWQSGSARGAHPQLLTL